MKIYELEGQQKKSGKKILDEHLVLTFDIEGSSSVIYGDLNDLLEKDFSFKKYKKDMPKNTYVCFDTVVLDIKNLANTIKNKINSHLENEQKLKARVDKLYLAKVPSQSATIV